MLTSSLQIAGGQFPPSGLSFKVAMSGQNCTLEAERDSIWRAIYGSIDREYEATGNQDRGTYPKG